MRKVYEQPKQAPSAVFLCFCSVEWKVSRMWMRETLRLNMQITQAGWGC